LVTVNVTFASKSRKEKHMSLMKDHILLNDLPLFRSVDPDTSREGAKDVRPRQGSQMALLLSAYANHRILGITDEEAGQESGLASRPRCCYWKRCSDLRNAGLIEDTGDRKEGSSGSLMMISRITAKGWEAYNAQR
jgi:hypothetical protein